MKKTAFLLACLLLVPLLFVACADAADDTGDNAASQFLSQLDGCVNYQTDYAIYYGSSVISTTIARDGDLYAVIFMSEDADYYEVKGDQVTSYSSDEYGNWAVETFPIVEFVPDMLTDAQLDALKDPANFTPADDSGIRFKLKKGVTIEGLSDVTLSIGGLQTEANVTPFALYSMTASDYRNSEMKLAFSNLNGVSVVLPEVEE